MAVLNLKYCRLLPKSAPSLFLAQRCFLLHGQLDQGAGAAVNCHVC